MTRQTAANKAKGFWHLTCILSKEQQIYKNRI